MCPETPMVPAHWGAYTASGRERPWASGMTRKSQATMPKAQPQASRQGLGETPFCKRTPPSWPKIAFVIPLRRPAGAARRDWLRATWGFAGRLRRVASPARPPAPASGPPRYNKRNFCPSEAASRAKARPEAGASGPGPATGAVQLRGPHGTQPALSHARHSPPEATFDRIRVAAKGTLSRRRGAHDQVQPIRHSPSSPRRPEPNDPRRSHRGPAASPHLCRHPKRR